MPEWVGGYNRQENEVLKVLYSHGDHVRTHAVAAAQSRQDRKWRDRIATCSLPMHTAQHPIRNRYSATSGSRARPQRCLWRCQQSEIWR